MAIDRANAATSRGPSLGIKDVRSAALVAFAVATFAMDLQADAQTSRPNDLTIPAQSLDEALDAYAAATGLQILYDSSLSRGRRSSAVLSAPNARTGLDLLLRGTGLSARFTGGGAVVIHASTSGTVLNPITAVATPSIGGPAPASAALDYVDIVQADLIRFVREEEALSRETYTLRMAVWVSEVGRVDQLEILRGSGNDALDVLFVDALLDRSLSARPPAQLPQPLRIELHVRQRQE